MLRCKPASRTPARRPCGRCQYWRVRPQARAGMSLVRRQRAEDWKLTSVATRFGRFAGSGFIACATYRSPRRASISIAGRSHLESILKRRFSSEPAIGIVFAGAPGSAPTSPSVSSQPCCGAGRVGRSSGQGLSRSAAVPKTVRSGARGRTPASGACQIEPGYRKATSRSLPENTPEWR